MPSLRAQLAHWLVWYKFYNPRRQSESELLEDIRTSYAQQDVALPPPEDIEKGGKFEVVREEKRLPAGQTWKIDHVSKKDGAGSDKVLVYWHGGAFIRKAVPFHWKFIAHLVESTGVPTIIPHYTLAPMSTSSHATLAALQLLIDLDSDPRYAGKEIILMGDSAGGWFVGQLLATLTKLALGEKIGLVGEDEIERVEVVERIRGRMKKAILISPALEMDMGSTEHPEDEEIQADDSWLNYKTSLIFGRLWAQGPAHATPSVSYDFPSTAPVISSSKYTIPPSVSLIDERMNPTRAIDVLQRYAEKTGHGGIKILQMCGTADILHRHAIRMDAKLKSFGSKVVRPELIVEPGLFHVYPLLQFTPEAQFAISRIKELMLEDD